MLLNCWFVEEKLNKESYVNSIEFKIQVMNLPENN
jgi:hypothetical protein